MWRISGKLENDQAIIKVGLQRFLPRPDAVQAAPATLEIPVAECRALIDTGATLTVITRSAIRNYGLQHFGLTQVLTGDGIGTHKRYIFHLGLVCEYLDRSGRSNETFYQIPEPQDAVDMPDNGSFDIIIGMNILKKCDFHMDRFGKFTITIEEGAFAT